MKLCNIYKRVLHESIAVYIGLCLVVASVHADSALCESRCEMARPTLQQLRTRWQRLISFHQNGTTFEEFIQSLIIASKRYSRLQAFGEHLEQIVEDYGDCVRACEHHHSKRNMGRQIITIRRVFEVREH